MRRFIRHPTNIPIDIQLAPDQSEKTEGSCMSTVSHGGLSCEVDSQLNPGSKINICIPSVSPTFQGEAEVVWCRESNGRFEIGVQFCDAQDAYKSQMVQQVCQIERYKNTVYKEEGRMLTSNEAAKEWIEKYAENFSEEPK